MDCRKLIIQSFMCFTLVCTARISDYFKTRDAIIEIDDHNSIGANMSLTKREEIVNDILMAWKKQEIEDGLVDPETFLAGQHFFKARPQIERSEVFKIIRKLPKGASLHSHDKALVSGDYVFYNITFRKNLYVKETENKAFTLKFFKEDPGLPWVLVSKRRQLDSDFDRKLKKQLSLFRENPETSYPDVYKIWPLFQNMFHTLGGFLTYVPVFKDHFYQALKELYEDNVRYIEFRGGLPELYDLDGKTYGHEEVVKIFFEISKIFIKDYPDFWGVKFIFAPSRISNNTAIEGYVDFFTRMNIKFPGFVAGFDLVGQEDTGTPLRDYIPALLKLKAVTNFFFHAGETLWNGVYVDENLVDAILLNSVRIGHGYAVVKHPEILKLVKERGIALEICPISNQVLGLVKDLRNHPANYLIANDYPIVIASDDPGLWGAKGLSYDWYLAFMAMSKRESDLRLLKQLAINSIKYSSMEKKLKKKALRKWEQDWNIFLKDISDQDHYSTKK